MDRDAAQSIHGMLAPATVEEFAQEAFWHALTMHLEAQVRPGLRSIYEGAVEPGLAGELGHAPDHREIAAAMGARPEEQWWRVLRTTSQRESSRATRRIVERQRPELEARAHALGNGPGTLTLDPELPMPGYLEVDIHLQAGGYLDGDGFLAGATYDRGISLARGEFQGPLHDDVGRSLAAWLKAAHPDFHPKRILELGCGVGHTATALKPAFPDAELHAVDVSGPLLRYGFARAAALGVEIHFHQQNAERTRFPDESFDLVYSRILMHETSASAVPNILAESRRLLRPGGMMFHSDAPPYDEMDAYAASLREWDQTFNNEPFMHGYYEMDLEAAFERAGFDRGRMFRAFPPSLRLIRDGVPAVRSRTFGGRYFLAGAFK
jgi:ubiquinone/menaquinone biosynthesis C-methylase UbiE